MKMPKGFLCTAATEGEVLQNEKAQAVLQNLDLAWLKQAAEVYCISPNVEDYVLVTTLITISDLPNRNGVAFPLEELIRFQEPPLNRLAFEGWRFCPCFYNHCFTAEALVATPTGYKQICDIKVGDEVYTHRKRVRKVTKVFVQEGKKTQLVDALGIVYPFCATENHPVWVVDARQLMHNPDITAKVVKERHESQHMNPLFTLSERTGLTKDEISSLSSVGNRKRRWLRHSDIELKPHFRPIEDVYPGDYLVSPILIGGNISVDKDFAFLCGVYVAEGNVQPSAGCADKYVTGITITVGYTETHFQNRIIECCEHLGFAYTKSIQKKNNTCAITIRNKEFGQYCRNTFSCYSGDKRIGGEARNWDKESLLHFLAGYISGDGCLLGQRIRCVTTSIDLAVDLQQALAYVGVAAAADGGENWPTQFTNKRYDKHFHLHELSEARRDGKLRKGKGGKPTRKTNDTYAVSMSFHEMPEVLMNLIVKQYDFKADRKRIVNNGPRIIIYNGWLLFPISIRSTFSESETVYNLEVEEDHSYLVNSVAVHNCNEDCTKAKGVVFDVSLRKVEGYNNDKLWKVVGVLGFDKTKDPELAHRIATGDINTYSMGALADFFTCSYCGAVISDKSHCTHINSVDDVNFREVVSYDGQSHVAFLNAHCISPIEVSAVEDPAWVPALSDTVIQGAEPVETETVNDDGKVEQTESVKFPKGFADWNPYGGY